MSVNMCACASVHVLHALHDLCVLCVLHVFHVLRVVCESARAHARAWRSLRVHSVSKPSCHQTIVLMIIVLMIVIY